MESYSRRKNKKMIKALLWKSSQKLIKAQNKRIVIFGAGNTSELYVKCLKTEHITPFCWFDNDKRKIGNCVIWGGGSKIFSPDKIEKDMFVLISSRNRNMFDSISRQLDGIKIPYMGIDEYVFAKRTDELLSCIQLLEDDKSVEIFSELIRCRIKNLPIPDSVFEGNQYFCLPRFAAFNPKETFVDCGAFCGDTTEQFIFKRFGSFNKIFAFEPDKKNFTALKKRVARLTEEWALEENKIICIQAGIGLKTEQGSIEEKNDAGSRISLTKDITDCANTIMIYALDDYFKNQCISFIKADIESYEIDMLRGAELTIKRDHPKLAIAIYHNASDMYQILLYLHSLNAGYKFAIRHHTPDDYDTILYAY